MAVRISTGLRNYMLDSGVNTAFDGGAFLDIYTGAQPANADTAPSGTLLASVSLPADPFAAAAAGAVALQGTWVDASADASGTAGWARIRTNADAGGASTTLRRLDGSVTASGGGGDFQLSTVSITSGQQVSITSGSLTQPAS
jgi:hypothetical protein